MTAAEAMRVAGVLRAAFPNQRFTEENAAMYAEMLSDLDFAQTLAVCKRLIAQARFFPSIAEIREAVAELAVGKRRDGMSAWADVLAEVKRVGYMGRPKWDDPLITQALQAMGGWQAICESENATADRVHFARVYDDLRRRAVTEANVGTLPEPPKRAEIEPPTGGNGNGLVKRP